MPWCPECKTEYVPGIDFCADCGQMLVSDDPSPIAQKPQALPIDALLAGFVGAVIGWILSYLIPGSLRSADASTIGPGVYVTPTICATTGFFVGLSSEARFVSTLIGWLIVSTPVFMAAGLGYAHDDPIPIPVANLIWFAFLSPVVLGPLSTVAGALYSRNPRASLAMWLVPTGLVVAAIFVASIVIRR